MRAGIREIRKMAGMMVISACAVFVCTLFLNYYMDLKEMKDQIAPGAMELFYEAQTMTCRVVCAVTGGCLLLTAVVMLFFYIRHYIDAHRKELGIQKALGYSNLEIAKSFWTFGLGVFLGTGLGFGGAWGIMPLFYEVQNEDGLLPEVPLQFQPLLLLTLVLAPTLAFALLSVGYGCMKLKGPVLELMGGAGAGKLPKHGKKGDKERPFLEELRRSTLRQRRSLTFFMAFGAFCYSCTIQMSADMDELASVMMGLMMAMIGIVLAVTALFLASATVVKSNDKTIAMMRALGYSVKECRRAVLGGYRPVAYLGFALGTIYQYGLLRLMVDLVFSGVEGVPEYSFDVSACLITLASFALLYELMIYGYARRINRISVKEIMMDGE